MADNNFDPSRFDWTKPTVVDKIDGYKNNAVALAVTVMTDTETGKTTKNLRLGKGYEGKHGDFMFGKTFFQFKEEMLPDIIEMLNKHYSGTSDEEAEEAANEEY